MGLSVIDLTLGPYWRNIGPVLLFSVEVSQTCKIERGHYFAILPEQVTS